MNRTKIQAYRHEITGQFYAMSVEDRAAFDAHCKAIRDDYDPKPGRELWLAQSIAEDMWRLDRARAEESNIYAFRISGEIGEDSPSDSSEVHSAVCHARTWLKDGHLIQSLALFETRVRRNIEKSQKELHALQAERRALYEKAFEEAKLLAQLAEYEGETLDPDATIIVQADRFRTYPAEMQSTGNTGGQVHGFAFSTREIIAVIRREARLAQARELRNQGWKPVNIPDSTLNTAPKTMPRAA